MEKNLRKLYYQLKKVKREKQDYRKTLRKKRYTLSDIIDEAPTDRYLLREYLAWRWTGKKKFTSAHLQQINQRINFELVEWDRILGIAISEVNDMEELPELYFERIMDIFFLMNKGADTFGSYDSFKEWLTEPNAYFDDRRPMDYLESSTGVNYLFDTLSQLNYGVIV